MCKYSKYSVKDNVLEFTGSLEFSCASTLYYSRHRQTMTVRTLQDPNVTQFFRLYSVAVIKHHLPTHTFGEGKINIVIKDDLLTECLNVDARIFCEGPDIENVAAFDWGCLSSLGALDRK